MAALEAVKVPPDKLAPLTDPCAEIAKVPKLPQGPGTIALTVTTAAEAEATTILFKVALALMQAAAFVAHSEFEAPTANSVAKVGVVFPVKVTPLTVIVSESANDAKVMVPDAWTPPD
jgi:hypothetical protein